MAENEPEGVKKTNSGPKRFRTSFLKIDWRFHEVALSGRRAGKRKIPLASKNEDCLVLQPCLRRGWRSGRSLS